MTDTFQEKAALFRTLPETRRMIFQSPSEIEGVVMDFRLVYRGPLPAQGKGDSRARDKQAIRKALHPQLRELWNQNRDRWGDPSDKAANFGDLGGFRRCPVITKRHVVGCSIDILFLRRDSPENLIRSGGDIDNRIKVLFDGLRMPQECAEFAGASPQPDEDPFFFLLQDDSLITEVHITTDRLLVPTEDEEHIHDVALIIHVVSHHVSPTMEEFIWTQHRALEALTRTYEKDC
jgi:hypothetical protein